MFVYVFLAWSRQVGQCCAIAIDLRFVQWVMAGLEDDESSEWAHVSGNEVACYRMERALMGCAEPPFYGGR